MGLKEANDADIDFIGFRDGSVRTGSIIGLDECESISLREIIEGAANEVDEEVDGSPNVTIIYDRILVKVDDAEEFSSGGIIIPGDSREKSIKGVIVRTGEGRLMDDGDIVPLIVREGDSIHFSKNAGMDIELGGDKFLIMRENDILAIVN